MEDKVYYLDYNVENWICNDIHETLEVYLKEHNYLFVASDETHDEWLYK